MPGTISTCAAVVVLPQHHTLRVVLRLRTCAFSLFDGFDGFGCFGHFPTIIPPSKGVIYGIQGSHHPLDGLRGGVGGSGGAAPGPKGRVRIVHWNSQNDENGHSTFWTHFGVFFDPPK